MEENKNQIVIYSGVGRAPKIEVKLENDTVWLSQALMAQLFGIERSVVTKHLSTVFKTHEVDEKSNVQFLHIANSDKPVKFYSLDVIISVGYRINSKKATQFRIWATRVLRDYITKGFTVNPDRLKQIKGEQLDELESAVALIRRTIETRRLTGTQEKGLLRVITDYTNSWVLLTKYDNHEIHTPTKISKSKYAITYEDTVEAIENMRRQLAKKLGDSDLYGRERQDGLKAIVGAVNQTYGRKPLYPSIEHQAAHLLYFLVKDHPFVDGNKRIGAFLFIYYLSRSNYLLKKNGERKINDNALVALTLLVAESDPKEKEVIVKLIMNFIAK